MLDTTCMYLSNPSTLAGCDTRSIFKQSLTDLISEFSFSSMGCHSKIKLNTIYPYFISYGDNHAITSTCRYHMYKTDLMENSIVALICDQVHFFFL